jgi:DNA-binding transcriptional ArsR family regulator
LFGVFSRTRLYKCKATITLTSETPPLGETMENNQIDAMAKLLKSMSHPIRLKILCLLQDKELSVGEIRSQVKTTNANISQHLNILRGQGIIDFRKDANFIYNKISDKRILELIRTMHSLFCPSL